jgi:hypothetical protein
VNDWLRSSLRAGPWLGFALLAALIVALLHPYQLGVLVWSLCKLCFGAYLGYWIDRSIFPYARPHLWIGDPHELRTGSVDRLQLSIAIAVASQVRRALIMAATILGLAVGV